MIQQIHDLSGLKITSIEIRTEEDAQPAPDEAQHMAYRIIVKTDVGWVQITGCHDMGPQVVILPPPYSMSTCRST